MSASTMIGAEERRGVRQADVRRAAGIGDGHFGTNFEGESLVDIGNPCARNVLLEGGYGPVTVCGSKVRGRGRSDAKTMVARHLKTHGDHGRYAS